MAITKKNEHFYYDYEEENEDGTTNTVWVPVEQLKGRHRKQAVNELQRGRAANVKNRDLEESENLLKWMKKKKSFSNREVAKLEQRISAEKKLFD